MAVTVGPASVSLSAGRRRDLYRFSDRDQQYRGYVVIESGGGKHREWSLRRARHHRQRTDRDG